MNLIGVDYFGHVTFVKFLFRGNDADSEQIGRLTRLQWVGVVSGSLTDAGLANLHALTDLSMLELGAFEVTDAGLTHLSGLTKLTHLNLRGTPATGCAGLGRIWKG